MAVRLYVGGLPTGVTSEELAGRFTSFGDVQSTELAPPKTYTTLHAGSSPEKFSRNFGYVELVPNDEKSLARAMGLYNGARWRDGTLRCQVARPKALEVLSEERREDEEVEEEVRGRWVFSM